MIFYSTKNLVLPKKMAKIYYYHCCSLSPIFRIKISLPYQKNPPEKILKFSSTGSYFLDFSFVLFIPSKMNQADIHVSHALCFPFLTSKTPGII